MTLRPPNELGFNNKFTEWRPSQLKAIDDGIKSRKRFIGQMQRVGAGKSLSYMAIAKHLGARTMILTSTLGLQAQLLEDFEDIGLVEMKGKSNYMCMGRMGKTCEDGAASFCPHAGSSVCPYNDARRIALDAQFVTSNYSCWIAINRFGSGLGEFDFLVLDEVHQAPVHLEKAMQVRLKDVEIREGLDIDWPSDTWNMEAWRDWARTARKLADDKFQVMKLRVEKKKPDPPLPLVKEFLSAKSLKSRLHSISNCAPDKWVPDQSKEMDNGFVFDPVDASQYGETVIFRHTPKVLMTSGTIRRNTLEHLGIDINDNNQFDFYPYNEGWNIVQSKSPLYYLPTVYVTRNTSYDDLLTLVARIDEIFEARADRKGIVHTSNFDLRNFIMEHSKFGSNGAGYFRSNYPDRGDKIADVVAEFNSADPPAWLVTPSVSTGYDFSHERCRVQIIAKLPYPNTFATAVDRKRSENDPKRGIYQMWQSLAQAFGRGDRAEDDFQEVFVLDNCIRNEILRTREYAPPWLLGYYREIREIPKPPSVAEDWEEDGSFKRRKEKRTITG